MFGPDICGSTKKVHVILHKNGENKLIKKNIPAESDEWSHSYTLVLSPDNTYEVYIDGTKKESGTIEEDWDILPPKKIRDPALSKPSDWVDERFIDDPEDKKPAGWDDIPAEILSADAKKPDDWDDELDGEWEAPKVANPEYKGPWSAKKIDNPAYKGEWVHPEIDNPDYKPDPLLYSFDSFKYVGIDIWQVKSGSIFSNFVISDDFEEAKPSIDKVTAQREGEKKVKEAKDEEAKKAEEAAKAAEASEEPEEPEPEAEKEKEDL